MNELGGELAGHVWQPIRERAKKRCRFVCSAFIPDAKVDASVKEEGRPADETV